MNLLLITLLCLLFPLGIHAAGEPRGSLASARWEQRVLAYVVASESERAALEARLERWANELEDRDMVLVNLGAVELESGTTLRLERQEKERLRELWGLDLSESRFVLVGKDGGAKAFQRDTLDLPELFARVDAMPMRAAELRQRGEVSRFR